MFPLFLSVLFGVLLTCDGLSTTEAPYSCQQGYTLLNNDVCVKLFESPLRLDDAIRQCGNEGLFYYGYGKLVSIHTKDELDTLLSIAKAQNVVSPVWIGLTCPSTQAMDCLWVDRSSVYYHPFSYGNPKPENGDNVYMLTSGSSAGQWVSVNGAVASFGYFCAIHSITSKTFCPNQWNDYCYTYHNESLNEADSRSVCQKECGDLVSVHSDAENNHVSLVVPYDPLLTEIRLGGRVDGNQKYWVDGSEFSFSKFGYLDTNIGNCFGLQVKNDLVYRDWWLSNNCADEMPFVCKRLINATSCPYVPSTTPNSPYVNFDCGVVKHLTGTGTLYAPPYLYSGEYGPCVYVISQPKGSIAKVQFLPNSEIKNSRFTLYSQLEGGQPFANLTGTLPLTVFSSPTNVLKMIYTGEPTYPTQLLNYSANYWST
ncbi:hypothetical protein CAEBREN_22337 [Caenorhabditis brenneri]|uniref:C-type LECtin n=1 Tax=Caenorhabditis brenneri TaxID=135651 RepID=G0N147_CAEBE|nr:hypothetical protein CAEBREN_22337 [Caenorhabditis brenneri]